MLQKMMQDLKGDRIEARDGAIGSVRDVYFDDERWAVRYLVVDTGEWLPGKKVLISPASLPAQEGGGDYLRVALSREEVRNAPGIDEDPPISRALEAAHARYFRYPYYWAGPYLWGAAAVPLAPPAEYAQGRNPAVAPAANPEVGERLAQAEQQARESHLRSGAEVIGYTIRAEDGEIGHVEDLLVDDRTWAIADMVVDTRNWLPGKKVLVPPEAIADIDWATRAVSVKLSREQLKRSPEAP